jgi:predicted MPP superfamily phosphohydrolase
MFINFTGAASIFALTAGHARYVAPFRVQFNTLPMPLRGLGEQLAGFRILHLADLHTAAFSVDYLRALFDDLAKMPWDLAVITGDFVSSDVRHVESACDIVARLREGATPGRPVVATLGNHDYSHTEIAYLSHEVADLLTRELEARQIVVLRNALLPVERQGARLWLAGFEDLWSGDFRPEPAMAQVPAGEPVVALSHSPDTGPKLARLGAQWVLAGHTHGGQIRLPLLPPLMLSVQNKRFISGLFRLKANDARMFVSRGVGCRIPVRFRCPPQVTTFVLERG